jgi:hypothetical protein
VWELSGARFGHDKAAGSTAASVAASMSHAVHAGRVTTPSKRTITALAALFAFGLALLGCKATRMAESASARDTSAEARALTYLMGTLRPWPEPTGPYALSVTAPASGRIAIYDNALMTLVMLRTGRVPQARGILLALAKLQADDGSIAFSFIWPRPDVHETYVRTGALAWVGYAAVDYLNATSDPTQRDVLTVMSHRIAAYLLAHQIDHPGDLRDGLITGGMGTYRYELGARGPREVFVPGEIEWTATEHNIDAFFFLEALGRVSGQAIYQHAAQRIADALVSRGWNADSGQLLGGFHQAGSDRTLALDCASWGALFLLAAGHQDRAETAASVADLGYSSFAARDHAQGHKPYRHKPLIENLALARHYAASLPNNNWDKFDAVWPEGSAGVALAALRVGATARARDILDGLEALRRKDGSLPTLTTAIPFEFDVDPSVGGTAWVELARYELDHPSAPRLWALSGARSEELANAAGKHRRALPP